MKTIRDLTNRVEEAHTKHLQEVKSLEEQTRNVSAKNSPQVLNQPITDDTVSFENLVQGGKSGGHISNDNGNDMFDTLVGHTPQQKPIATAATWNQSPSITPSTLQPQNVANNSNGWNSKPASSNTWNKSPSMASSTLQPQTMMNNNNGLNTQSTSNTWIKPIAPITPSTNTWNTKPTTTNSTWSQPIKPINSPSKPIQPIASPNNLNMSMNQMSLNTNKPNSNYDALRSFSSGNTPQPSMIGLLKPITPSSNTSLQNNMPQASKANLHAFDPLG